MFDKVPMSKTSLPPVCTLIKDSATSIYLYITIFFIWDFFFYLFLLGDSDLGDNDSFECGLLKMLASYISKVSLEPTF